MDLRSGKNISEIREGDERVEMEQQEVSGVTSGRGDTVLTTSSLLESIQQMFGNFKTEIGEQFREFKTEIKQEWGKHADTLKAEIYTEINRESEQRIEAIHKVAEKIEERDILINAKITEIDISGKKNTEDINALQNASKSLCFDRHDRVKFELKYAGENKLHPKIFIRQLGQYVGTYGLETNIKQIIQGSLCGEAELWYQLVEDRYNSFEQFETLFLNHFWGEHAQQKVRFSLFNGKYSTRFGCSREKYVLQKYYNVRHLEPALTETEIVKFLSRHFDEDIHKVIVVQRITTMDQLIEYMRSLDDVWFTRRVNKNFDRANDVERLERPIEGGQQHSRTESQARVSQEQTIRNQVYHDHRRQTENQNCNRGYNRQNQDSNWNRNRNINDRDRKVEARQNDIIVHADAESSPILNQDFQ